MVVEFLENVRSGQPGKFVLEEDEIRSRRVGVLVAPVKEIERFAAVRDGVDPVRDLLVLECVQKETDVLGIGIHQEGFDGLAIGH